MNLKGETCFSSKAVERFVLDIYSGDHMITTRKAHIMQTMHQPLAKYSYPWVDAL